MYLSCFFWSKNIKAQIVLYSSILFLKMFSKLGIHLGKGSKTPGTETFRWGLHGRDFSEKLAEKS